MHKDSVRGKRTHREITRSVRKQNGIVEEGRNHTLVGKDGDLVAIPRHNGDLATGTAASIVKSLLKMGFHII